MTTIGSTNTYYASSLSNVFGNRSTNKAGSESGDPNSLMRHPSSGGLTGSDPMFGAKLADMLWSMEGQGVEIDQSANDAFLGKAPSTTPEDEFMDLASKSFAERIREQYLDAHGLTEDDLKAMSPEDREAIEAEIRKAILEAMGVNGQRQEAGMNIGAGALDAQAGDRQAGTTRPVANTNRQDGNDDPLLSP
ncbi:hypothetical protein M0654_21810 [Rhizobium sp. NTR19]|uniref:Uncharacterized protein n=1 Tax=Neorhizobium turbinariae TaxID=2937795 RepID=A0ABT0IXJ9_9HYPH|nr:hypothetical protein [Neorhizobium turbinariae]MCK8782608.1 hypothetical protein [Neorhizobium turbinariae]